MLSWQSNYIHFNERKGDPEAQIFWLAVLARGISAFIDDNLVKGNWRNERLCRWALANIRRFADFRCMQPGKSEYLKQIRDAQIRLEGLFPCSEKLFSSL